MEGGGGDGYLLVVKAREVEHAAASAKRGLGAAKRVGGSKGSRTPPRNRPQVHVPLPCHICGTNVCVRGWRCLVCVHEM